MEEGEFSEVRVAPRPPPASCVCASAPVRRVASTAAVMRLRSKGPTPLDRRARTSPPSRRTTRRSAP
eukprot:2329947-Prymnesium_polylepis.1